jgi:hypothetical protein
MRPTPKRCSDARVRAQCNVAPRGEWPSTVELFNAPISGARMTASGREHKFVGDASSHSRALHVALVLNDRSWWLNGPL